MEGRKADGGKRQHRHTVLRETQATVRSREARLTPQSRRRTENVRRGVYCGLFAFLFCASVAPGRPAVKSRVYTTLRINIGTSTSINSIAITPERFSSRVRSNYKNRHSWGAIDMPMSVSREPDRGRAPFSPLSWVLLHGFFSSCVLSSLFFLLLSFPLPLKTEELFLDFGKKHGRGVKKTP